MARSRIKNGGPTRGRFKRKRLGKGWLANRSQPIGSRPVLRITEPDAATEQGDAKKAKTAKA